MRKIKIKSEADLYFKPVWDLYMHAFPLAEVRSFEDHKRALKDKAFSCFAYELEGKICAFMCSWELESFHYIEYIALEDSFQGQGLGSKIIKDFIHEKLEAEKLILSKIIILEIEKVCDIQTEQRWHFYERLGFHQYTKESYMHPPYQQDLPSVEMTLLTYQHELSEKEYTLFTKEEKKLPMKYAFYAL